MIHLIEIFMSIGGWIFPKVFSNSPRHALKTEIVTGENSLDYWGQMNDSYLGQQAFYESELRRRLSLFPNAQGAVIPDAGHMLHYDQPEAVNQVLRKFLG